MKNRTNSQRGDTYSDDLRALSLLFERAPEGREQFHPFDVGQALPSGVLRQAGYLHDLVEDGHATLEEVRALLGAEVAEAVEAVTRRQGETYADFVARAAAHPMGRQVKLADVRNNLATLPEGDSLGRRYRRALEVLEDS